MMSSPTRQTTGRGRYVCDRCGRAFARSEHLNRHVLAHDKKKPFTCSNCGLSYGRTDVLNRHMRKCLETTQRTINASIAAASQPQTSISAAPGVLMTPRSNGSATSQDFTAAMQLNSLANGGSGSNQVSISGLPALHSDGNLQYSTDRQLFHAADSDGSNLTLMPDLGFRCDIVPPSSMDYSFDEDMFLEDSLLFQFAYNHSGLTIPSTPTTRHQYLQNLPPDLTPIQTALSDSESPARADRSVHDALQITVGDLQGFHGNMDKIDSAGDLTYFRRPTLSRTLRCLIAYFQHFDLHTPIVHFASFKISEAHPALVLIMIAIGAVHLSESAFADSAYEACCILILQHDKASIRQPKEAFQLWYVQASVLAAQYGACTGDTDLFYRAQQHLSAVQTAIYKGLPEIHAAKRDSSNDWASWIYLETSSRLISWMFVVSSMFLALDPYSTAILPPMSCSMPAPSDESVWHAVSEIEWKIAQRAQPTPEADLWTIAKSVMLGEMPPESCGRISANSLLALIGAILATISTQQRLTMDIFDPYRGNTQRMERAISVWERLWRLHPRTERNMTRLDDPLLNDCLSLLGSAYYHLHLGEELFVLKKIAENPTLDLAFPPCNDRARCHKVIKFAANSWLVRAKLGITYLNKTGGLELGSQAITTAYESALILAWWLHLSDISRTSGVVQPSDHDPAGAAIVTRLFDEICNELDEQGIYYDDSGNPVLSPIDFYTSVLDGRVWKCCATFEKRLRNFATRLKQAV